jgi:hypothetical protein
VTGLQGAVEAARVAAINRLFAPVTLEAMTAAAQLGTIDRLFAPRPADLSIKEDNLRSEPGQVAGAGRMAQPDKEGGSSFTARRALAGTAIFVALAAPPLYETLRRFREGTDVG